MTFATLLPLLVTYGEPLSAAAMYVIQAIAKGRAGEKPNDDDVAELNRLSELTSAAIYGKLGIELPPAPAVAAAGNIQTVTAPAIVVAP